MKNKITERILAAADGNGGLAALHVSGSHAEWDKREGLDGAGCAWKDVLPEPTAPGFWVFEGWLYDTKRGAEGVDEGCEYHGAWRAATEAEVLAVIRAEDPWSAEVKEGRPLGVLLTTPQRRELVKLNTRPFRCNENYQPAVAIVRLGLATWEPTNPPAPQNPKLYITAAGRAWLAANP